MTKALLLLHTAAAVTAIAVTVHLLVRLRGATRERNGAWEKSRLHARMAGLFYLAVLITGILIYPDFRLNVRAAFLDAEHPVGTGLFEIKEHLAALGLIPALGVWALLRGRSPDAVRNPAVRTFVWVLATAILIILSWNAVTGWYLVTVRSI